MRKFEDEAAWKPQTESSIQNFHQEEQSLPGLLPGLESEKSSGFINTVPLSPPAKPIEVKLDLGDDQQSAPQEEAEAVEQLPLPPQETADVEMHDIEVSIPVEEPAPTIQDIVNPIEEESESEILPEPVEVSDHSENQ